MIASVDVVAGGVGVEQKARHSHIPRSRSASSANRAFSALVSACRSRSHAASSASVNSNGSIRFMAASALKSLRDEHARTIEPARAQAAEAQVLERRLSDLVNEAYGLTPDEVTLMWQTAPPRMPFAGPAGEPGTPI